MGFNLPVLNRRRRYLTSAFSPASLFTVLATDGTSYSTPRTALAADGTSYTVPQAVLAADGTSYNVI